MNLINFIYWMTALISFIYAFFLLILIFNDASFLNDALNFIHLFLNYYFHYSLLFYLLLFTRHKKKFTIHFLFKFLEFLLHYRFINDQCFKFNFLLIFKFIKYFFLFNFILLYSNNYSWGKIF